MKIRKIDTVYISAKAHEPVMYCLKGILSIMLAAVLILCMRAVTRIRLPEKENAAVMSNVTDNRSDLENFGPASREDILNRHMKKGLSPSDILDSVKASTVNLPSEKMNDLNSAADEMVLTENGSGTTVDVPPPGNEDENNPGLSLSVRGRLDMIYCVGSTVELDGIRICMNDRDIPLSECVIGTADTRTPGEKTVTVAYGEMSVEIPYKVEVYTAVLHGNGGNVEQESVPLWNYVMDELAVEIPARPGKEFAGWYKDPDCTVPFEGAVPGETVTDIYAGWKEFKNFLCDDEGYIIGYPGGSSGIQDGVLNISHHPDCIGIRSGAFSSLGKEVLEVYIPANITDIPPDAFDTLVYLMFIYVEPSNPVYYSDGNGIVYRKDTGEMVLYPQGNPEINL